MTIKHLGGIFGRNPTFNDVDVDGYLDVDGGTLYVDPSNDRIGVNTTTPTTTAHIKSGIYNHFIGDGTLITGSNFSADSTVAYGTTAYASLAFYTWNQQRGRFTPEGDLQLNTGNLIVANGKGIDFSATPGTGTSELFDDYEEGSWTPTLIGTTSAGTGTYTIQDGKYTKVGNLVTFQMGLSWSAHTGTGTMQIQGLPYTTSSTGIGTAAVYVSDIGSSAGTLIQCFVSNSTTDIRLRQVATGGGSAAGVAMDTAGQMFISGHYYV